MIDAIIFDCDGVLVDTERDGHRVAFNQAFAAIGIDVEWNVKEYKALVKIAGGKERMKYYFDNNGWPNKIIDQEKTIKDLHVLKTNLFMKLIEEGTLLLRPGVARLVDEAIAANVMLAVCSTSNEKAVTKIVERLFGDFRRKKFSGIFAGDVVLNKKPDPAIYILCAEKLSLNPKRCVVVEDSRNGLVAARAAGFNCIITTNDYTKDEDFKEADAIYTELGDHAEQVTVKSLSQLIDF